MQREAREFVRYEATRTTKADGTIPDGQDFFISLSDMEDGERDDPDLPGEFVAGWYRQ